MSNADQYTLETPENIEVEFEVAGLGSRFCAMAIDTAVLTLIVLVLILLAAILGFTRPACRPGTSLPALPSGWLAVGPDFGDGDGVDLGRILHPVRIADARPDAGQEGHEDPRHPR